MIIRKATLDDIGHITSLYRDTITTVNINHYNLQQVTAWANRWSNIPGWTEKVHNQHFLVAEEGKMIVGFSSITQSGHVDMLFVHHNYQGQGVGSKLVRAIEQFAIEQKLTLITTDASITARPVFEHFGFTVVAPQIVAVDGVELANYKMQKELISQQL